MEAFSVLHASLETVDSHSSYAAADSLPPPGDSDAPELPNPWECAAPGDNGAALAAPARLGLGGDAGVASSSAPAASNADLDPDFDDECMGCAETVAPGDMFVYGCPHKHSLCMTCAPQRMNDDIAAKKRPACAVRSCCRACP